MLRRRGARRNVGFVCIHTSTTLPMISRIAPLAGALLLACLPSLAAADVVTGTLTPATAKAVIVDGTGKTVAELKPGA